MSNKIGGGAGAAKGPREIDRLSEDAALGETALASESAPGSGTPRAKTTARPKSVDMKGLDLQRQLEERLKAKLAAMPPSGTTTVTVPKGPDPRPHVGAADAKAIEDLLETGDKVKVANETLKLLKNLAIIDREGLRLNPNATEADVNRFKVCLNVLEEHGKLDDLCRALSGADPKRVLWDGKPFGGICSPDEPVKMLIDLYGSKSQIKTWG